MTSSKYSEKNVLKIKRDIQLSSDVLLSVNKQKEEALSELNALRELIKIERESHEKKIANIWIQVGEDLKTTQNTRKIFESDIIRLSSEKILLEYQISLLSNLLKDTIKHIVDEKNKYTFIPNLIEETKKILSFLTSKKNLEQETVKTLEIEKNNLEKGVTELKKFEDEYKQKIENLESIIVENTEKISKLLKERDAMQSVIDEIQKRDHDSRVMAFRLTDEYKKVYFNRKK